MGIWPEKAGGGEKFGRFRRTFTDDFLEFWPFSAHFAHFFKKMGRHFGQQKPSIYAALRTVCPLSHFFLQTIMIKKLKIYSNGRKKVGIWPETRKEKNMLKKILRELVAIRKELQDIKLILKFHCLGSNYRTEHERVDGKVVVKSRRVLPDPLEELRKEERILRQYRESKIEYLPNK